MTKFILLILGGLFAGPSVKAQSKNDKITKAIKSSDRREQSAKADVRLINRKKIFDSAAILQNKLAVINSRNKSAQ